MPIQSRFSISVRNLAEDLLRAGDLHRHHLGRHRLAEGVRGHREVQASRPPGYAAEVWVSRTVGSERFELTVSGRIDGVFTGPSGVVVEEIKTVGGPAASFLAGDPFRRPNPVHWGQAKIYAALYAEAHDLAAVDVQLTYYHLRLKTARSRRESFDRSALQGFFDEVTGAYIARLNRWVVWRACRDRSVAKTPFPYPAPRPGQSRMAGAVERAIRARRPLLVEAPTGIGKTLAALRPAVAALASGEASAIFYLTARTTGATAAEAALDDLRSVGLRLRSLTLTARNRICPDPEASCAPDACGRARGHFDRLAAAIEALLVQEAMTGPTVAAVAESHRVCPYHLSLETARWVDCVIGDYHYAFDPKVRFRQLLDNGAGRTVLLVDEAHNLPDRARESFSAALSRRTVAKAGGAVQGVLSDVERALSEIDDRMAELADHLGVDPAPEPPSALLSALERFCDVVDGRLADGDGSAALPEPVMDCYFDALGMLRTAEGFDAGYVTLVSRSGRNRLVRLFCVDPSGRLASFIRAARSAVFFSGTLRPTGYFLESFGIGETAEAICLPSPFPPDGLCVMIADRISTRYRHRERTAGAVAGMIQAFVTERRGNYLVFFPSHAYLRTVLSAFAGAGPEVDLAVQRPGMTEAERAGFLERFSEDNERTLVGFAVLGGIFGEGIDLVGDRLSGAAVVGVGLPPATPERELIRERMDGAGSSGYDAAYRVPGWLRVLQAVGRVVRSERDRGAVLLIDERLSHPAWEALFPETWRPERVSGPAEVAARTAILDL